MAEEHSTTGLTMVVPPEEAAYEKITVLLPKDTVSKIDQMAKIALLGSRGRTIQAVVDAVVDSAPDVGEILLHAQNMGQLAKSQRPGIIPNLPASQLQRVQSQVGEFLAMQFNLMQILGRLNKFLGVKLVEKPVSKN
jgi:hypothetical protein